MSKDKDEKQIAQKSYVGNTNKENKNRRNWWVEIVSAIAIGYLILSLIGPMFLQEVRQPPRKIETPDVILIALVLLFNSGLLNRLENFAIKEGGITANFKQLEREVNEQKQQIDKLQTKQIEDIEKQQKNLEDLQAFMYNFLLSKKDYEKIEQLMQHLEDRTNYKFYVSDKVGDELRRLRDWKLIGTNFGYISDIVQASEYGQRSIDLTQYLHVTDLGKKFLLTRQRLKSKDRQEMQNREESS